MSLLTQALCLQYYNKLNNYVGIHFIKELNFEFKNWKNPYEGQNLKLFFKS